MLSVTHKIKIYTITKLCKITSILEKKPLETSNKTNQILPLGQLTAVKDI